MPRLTHLLVVPLSLAALSACWAGLPEERPADFSLTRSDSGGMWPRWSRLEISADECHYTLRYQRAESSFRFEPTAAELDTLYQALREHLLAIDTEDRGEVHDRGGTTLKVKAAGETYDVSNMGSSFVTEGSREHWNAVLKAMGALMGPHYEKAVVEVPVVFAPSLEGQTVQVKCNGRMVFEGEAEAGKLNLKELPGSYVVDLVLRRPGDTKPLIHNAQLELAAGSSIRMGSTEAGLEIEAVSPK